MSKRKNEGKTLENFSESTSKRKKSTMTSPKFEEVELKLSWSNIQDQIASFILATAKGKIPENSDISSIKLAYAGGYLSRDKIIPVTILVRKGVSKLPIGKSKKLQERIRRLPREAGTEEATS